MMNWWYPRKPGKFWLFLTFLRVVYKTWVQIIYRLREKLLWLFSSITACTMCSAKQVSTQRRLWPILFFLVHNNACYNASRTDKEKPWPLSWLVLVREMVQLSRLGVYYDWYWRISGLHSISGAVIKGSRIGMCAGAVTLAVDILSLRSNNQRETTWRVWWLVLAHLWLTFYLRSYDQRESPWHECWCCNISGWHSNVEEPWPKMY